MTAVRRREPKSGETPAKERAAKPAETKAAETKTVDAKAAPVKKRRPPKRTSPAKETPAPPAKKQLYKSLILYHPDGVQKLPPSPFDSFSPRQISRSPAVLLDAFCQSPHFTQLFSQTPLPASADDVSPRGYLAHYYCGVTTKVLEACLQGDLDVEAVIASGDKPTEGLEAVLAWLPRCTGPVERVCVLRVLLLSALCSVYPPQVVATGQRAEGKHAGAQCDGGGEAPVAGESAAGRAGGGAEQRGDVSDRPEGLREGPCESQLRAAVSVSGGEGEGAAGVCELRRVLPQRVFGAAADGVLGFGADQDVRVLESGEGVRVSEVLQWRPV